MLIKTIWALCILIALAACSPENNGSVEVSLNATEAILATNIADAQTTLTKLAAQANNLQSANTPSVEAISTSQVNQIAESTSTPEPTRTPRPSNTPEPSDTDRPTRTPNISRVERSLTAVALTEPVLTQIAQTKPTNTTVPANTPRPAQVDTDTYYVTGSTANVRECATTTCSVMTALSYGDDIEVIERTEGVSVAGSTRWYRVLLNDEREGFIHSSLVSTTRPVAGTSGGGSGGTNNTSNVQPTAVPQQAQPTAVPQEQVQPTAVPQQIVPTQPPAPAGYACDCNKTCGAMTCEEAYFQLNQCGCGQRDNDNDGVPCESVCSGG